MPTTSANCTCGHPFDQHRWGRGDNDGTRPICPESPNGCPCRGAVPAWATTGQRNRVAERVLGGQ